MTEEVVKIMSHAKVSTLSSLVSALHRSGWSPENTLLPTSFPQMEYTKIENVPLEASYSISLPPRDFSDEGSLCDDFDNSCPIGIDDCSPLTLSFSSDSYTSVVSEKSTTEKVIISGDINVDLELGSPSDLDNWFDVVERKFQESNPGDEKTNAAYFLEPTSV